MSKSPSLWLVLVLAGCCLTLAGCPPQSSRTALQASQQVTQAELKQGERLTALEAYRVVVPKVSAWQANARIALGQAEPDNGDLDTDGRSSAWRFTCASADEQSYAIFVIDTTREEQKVRVLTSNVKRPAVTALIDPSAWKVDSPQALEIAQANGLKEWLANHSGYAFADTTIELRASAEEGPYWLIVAHSGQDTIDFRISAADGKVYHARSH